MKLTTTTTSALLILLGTTLASTSSSPSKDLNARDAGAISTPSNVHKRSCAVRQYGCENGYCWRKCDAETGRWCWLAFNGGNGDWVTCGSDADCKDPHDGNPSCANPEKPQGGCSC